MVRPSILLFLTAAAASAQPVPSRAMREVLGSLGHASLLEAAGDRLRAVLGNEPLEPARAVALERALAASFDGDRLLERAVERVERALGAEELESLRALASAPSLTRHAAALEEAVRAPASSLHRVTDPGRRREIVAGDPWKRERARIAWLEDSWLAILDRVRVLPASRRWPIAIPPRPSHRLESEMASLQKALTARLTLAEMEAYRDAMELPETRTVLAAVEREVEHVLKEALAELVRRPEIADPGIEVEWKPASATDGVGTRPFARGDRGNGGDASHVRELEAVGAAPDGKSIGVRHAGIEGMVFLAQPARIVTAGEDGRLRIWSVPGGDLEATFVDEPGRYPVLGADPLGKRIAAGDEFGMVHLWDLATGREIAEVQPHRVPVSFVTFSPDGEVLLSADYYGRTVVLWNLSRDSVAIVPALQGRVRFPGDAVLSAGGRQVTFFDTEGRPSVLDVASGKITAGEASLGGPDARGYILQDGQYLRTHPAEGVTLRKSSGEVVRALAGSAGFVPAHNLLAAAGSTFAAVMRFRHVPIWDLTTGVRRHEVRIPARLPASVAASADGVWIAIAEGSRASILDARAGRIVGPLDSLPPVRDLHHIGRDGDLATLDQDGTLRIRERSTGRTLVETASMGGTFVTSSGASVQVVEAGGQATLRVEAADVRASPAPAALSHGEQLLGLRAGGGRILRGTLGVVSTWDGQGASRAPILGPTVHAALPADGALVAGAMDLHFAGDVHVVEVATGRRLLILREHDAPVTAVAFDPGGGRLASVDHDGSLVVWALDPPAVLARARDPAGSLDAVEFSPEGHELVCAGASGRVHRFRVPASVAPGASRPTAGDGE